MQKDVNSTKLVRGMYTRIYGSWPVRLDSKTGLPRRRSKRTRDYTEDTFNKTIAGLNVVSSGKIGRRRKK